MAKGLRSKSRRKNIALKAKRLEPKENARLDRIVKNLQEATGVGIDTMDTMTFPAELGKKVKPKARLVVKDLAFDGMEGVIQGRVEKKLTKKGKRRERSKSLTRKLTK